MAIAFRPLFKRFTNAHDTIIMPTFSTEKYPGDLGVRALIETIPIDINMEDYTRWAELPVRELHNQYAAQGNAF